LTGFSECRFDYSTKRVISNKLEISQVKGFKN
jgi:hypothetical protein